MSALPSIVATAGAMSLALLGDQMLYVALPSRPEVAGVDVAALGLGLSASRFYRGGTSRQDPTTEPPSPAGGEGARG